LRNYGPSGSVAIEPTTAAKDRSTLTTEADCSVGHVALLAAGDVWTLTLTQPRKRNAISVAMRRELAEHLTAAAADVRCRCVVLTGAAGFFSAGGDLTESVTPGDEQQRFDLLADVVRGIVRGSPPVVAAVEGGAHGLAMSLAAACDLVVASTTARFSAAFVTRGLSVDGGISWTLPRRAGPAAARRLLLTGQVVEGAEAQALGLADVLTEPGSALAAAVAAAERIAACAATAIAGIRSLLSLDSDLDDHLEAEARTQRAVAASPEAQALLAEFRRRRATDDTAKAHDERKGRS